MFNFLSGIKRGLEIPPQTVLSEPRNKLFADNDIPVMLWTERFKKDGGLAYASFDGMNFYGVGLMKIYPTTFGYTPTIRYTFNAPGIRPFEIETGNGTRLRADE